MRDMLLQKILNAPVFTAFDKVHPIEQTRSWLRRLLERIRRPSKRAQRDPRRYADGARRRRIRVQSAPPDTVAG
jgi:hypothetical protein